MELRHMIFTDHDSAVDETDVGRVQIERQDFQILGKYRLRSIEDDDAELHEGHIAHQAAHRRGLAEAISAATWLLTTFGCP